MQIRRNSNSNAFLPAGVRISGQSMGAAARCATAILSAFILLGMLLERQWPFIPYFGTEWMITYEHGFIRRGAIGQTFWSLGALLHTPPSMLIELARISLVVGFAGVLGSLILKNKATLGLLGVLVLLTNPYSSFYLWCEQGSIDIFFVLITLWHLNLTKSDEKQYIKSSILLFGLVGVYLTLSQEIILLICLPINFLISWQKLSNPKLKNLTFIYAAPLVAGGFALAFHGTPAQASAIWLDWTNKNIHQPYHVGFEALGLRLPELIKAAWSDVSARNFLAWPVNVALCAAPVAILFRNLYENRDEQAKASLRKRVTTYLVFPFLASIPLFVVATDWDRWVSILLLTGTLCLLKTENDSTPIRWTKSLQLELVALILATLVIRPYTPFVPINRFFAGPVIRAEEYFRNQMPT